MKSSIHSRLSSWLFFSLLFALCAMPMACGQERANPYDAEGNKSIKIVVGFSLVQTKFKEVTSYWEAVTGAVQYFVYRSDDGTTFSKIGETSSLFYVDSGLEEGKMYWYEVTAVSQVGLESLPCEAKSIWSGWCTGDEYIDAGNYYIAKYEASRPDATSSEVGNDKSYACSRFFVLPWTNVLWNDAQAACEASGARLCTGNEWIDACDGVIGNGGSKYPYGNSFQRSTCNDEYAGKDDTVPTGSESGCISGFGIYDMSGNVYEWTDELYESDHVYRGGSFFDFTERFLSCAEVFWPYNPSDCPSCYIPEIVGFRCCRDK